MSIKSDKWIIEMCNKENMIDPFESDQFEVDKISYGLSSYGYDIRVSDEYKYLLMLIIVLLIQKSLIKIHLLILREMYV